MAAQRHPRKAAFRHAASGASLVALAFASSLPLIASTTEQIVVDRNSGLAIHGFDPIAYFTDGVPAIGKGQFEHRHAGAVWRFRNSGNMAAFVADPEVYMPRFGGYDPVGVGRGVPAAGDPRIWMIVDDRLYLFQSQESRALFAVDNARMRAVADEAWPAVMRTLAP
jgi:hypothetical protein